MSYANIQGAANQYRQVGVQGGVTNASPHRLIQMLLDGALEKISAAKGYMQHGEIADKGKHISWAIAIIEGLRASLDLKSGNEVAGNLAALYTYMEQRLVIANANNDASILDEVARLLLDIKGAWDAIPEDVKQAHRELMREKQAAAQQQVENP